MEWTAQANLAAKGRDPRKLPPRPVHACHYVPDLHIDTVDVGARGFR